METLPCTLYEKVSIKFGLSRIPREVSARLLLRSCFESIAKAIPWILCKDGLVPHFQSGSLKGLSLRL